MRIAIIVLIGIIALLITICYVMLVMLGRKDKDGTIEFVGKGDDLGEPSEIAQECKTQVGIRFPKVER